MGFMLESTSASCLDDIMTIYVRWVEVLTYLRPFKFLYRFPQVSQLKGFSFSMPNVPGYGALVSGLTIENVPSPFSWSC